MRPWSGSCRTMDKSGEGQEEVVRNYSAPPRRLRPAFFLQLQFWVVNHIHSSLRARVETMQIQLGTSRLKPRAPLHSESPAPPAGISAPPFLSSSRMRSTVTLALFLAVLQGQSCPGVEVTEKNGQKGAPDANFVSPTQVSLPRCSWCSLEQR